VSRVLTAAQIEAAAQEGWRELAVADGTVVTPLARDRAVALGLALVSAVASGAVGAPAEDDLPSSGRRSGGGTRVERLALESRVRILARRTLLRQGAGLARLEDVVASVLARLSEQEGAGCGCDGDGA